MIHPAPEVVYQTYDYASGLGNRLMYELPVADGTYNVRLHFAEPSNIAAGSRIFDIFLNDARVQNDFDIVAVTGAPYQATTLTVTGTATGGTGLRLELVNETANYGAILAGMEVTSTNPDGVASPTVDLEWSADGGSSFTTIATGLAMDRFGSGNYVFTAPVETDQGRVRVVAHDGSRPDDESDQLFQVANDGTSYYISTTGSNANTGKRSDGPMASLAALLAAYDLDPGDVILVDAGEYTLPTNIVLTAEDAGVRIQGPTTPGLQAVLDRANTANGSYVFELIDADQITLDHLAITGGSIGVYAGSTSDSDQVTIQNSEIFANYVYGIYLEAGNDEAAILDNTVHDHTYSSSKGIYIYGASAATVSGNTVYCQHHRHLCRRLPGRRANHRQRQYRLRQQRYGHRCPLQRPCRRQHGLRTRCRQRHRHLRPRPRRRATECRLRE